MRFIKYLILAAIAVVLVVVALGNRAAVTLNLVPESLAGFVPFPTSISLPLFVVIFLGIAVGLLIGLLWEWLREWKHRSAGRKEHKQVVRLEREVSRLKAEKNQGKDDVLALLDDAS